MARQLFAASILVAALCFAAPAAAAPRLFPSDEGATVRDPSQRTGKRIALRLPSCTARPSECNDFTLLNRLDGFDVDPRITVRFDRPIDVRRISRRTLFLQRAGRGSRIAVNRIVYDSRTRMLSARTTQQLRARTRYRLTVDLPGQRASTIFTTMDPTSQTRAMRAVTARRPPALRVTHRFAASTIRGLRARIDTGTGFAEAGIPDLARAGGGTYAFGSLSARQWLRPDRTIHAAGTRRTPAARGTERLAVSMIVPEGAKPRGGWPVAIFGHGFTRSQLDLLLAAEYNARRGIATLALTIPGHGGGPRGQLLVDRTDGTTATVPLPGRAVDLDADGAIGAIEGSSTALPPNPAATVASRDVLRQAALNVVALAAAVRRGVDVDGDGAADLSATRVGYYGQSFGAIYGTIALAIEPRLRPGVLNVGGGPIVDIARLSASFRPLLAAQLLGRLPDPGNGGPSGFTEAEPLYGAGPVVDPPAGAMAIDALLADARWLARSGSPEAYAPALRDDPRILVQVAFGDRTVPNPTSANLIRAGGLADRTALYRNDRTPNAARNPHGFLLDPSFGEGGAAAEAQALYYIERPRLRDPDGSGRVWELDPPVSVLDRLNFTPG